MHKTHIFDQNDSAKNIFLPTYLPYFFPDRYRKQTIFFSWPQPEERQSNLHLYDSLTNTSWTFSCHVQSGLEIMLFFPGSPITSSKATYRCCVFNFRLPAEIWGCPMRIQGSPWLPAPPNFEPCVCRPYMCGSDLILHEELCPAG